MILTVSFSGTTYNELPYRLEAGTPHIAGAVGIAAAMRYLDAWAWPISRRGKPRCSSMRLRDSLRFRGWYLSQRRDKAGLVSFNVEGIHPHIRHRARSAGVAIRAATTAPCRDGTLGLSGTARPHSRCYNTTAEIDQLVDAVRVAQRMFGMSAAAADLKDLYGKWCSTQPSPAHRQRPERVDREARDTTAIAGQGAGVRAHREETWPTSRSSIGLCNLRGVGIAHDGSPRDGRAGCSCPRRASMRRWRPGTATCPANSRARRRERHRHASAARRCHGRPLLAALDSAPGPGTTEPSQLVIEHGEWSNAE